SPEIFGNVRDDTTGRAAADRDKSHGWRSAACPQCQWLLVVGVGLAAINIAVNLDIVIIAGCHSGQPDQLLILAQAYQGYTLGVAAQARYFIGTDADQRTCIG